MEYRLGLDIGTNSIGWCVMELDGEKRPITVHDAGVRIFSDGRDPQDGSSLAVTRRVARQMRRRRDRYLRRRERLMEALVKHGFMPGERKERKALEALDPYEIRARGLDERLEPYQMGRALFHLNQRRGFRSNRKVDQGDEKESGKIKSAVGKLALEMERDGARTLGEYLHRRRKRSEENHRNEEKTMLPVRARLIGEGAKAEYELYPSRDMIEHEFDTLWAAQEKHDPALYTQEAREELRDIILFQRPLRPVQSGKCTLDPTDKRAPMALPLAQRFRIYQELNHLRLIEPDHTDHPLTLAQRDLLADRLLTRGKVTFDAMRKALKLEQNVHFSHETEKRKHFDGDQTAMALAKADRFGKHWRALAPSEQAAVVERLLDEESSDAEVAKWLIESYLLAPENAEHVAAARLPQGHSRLGRRALERIVPILEREVITYDKAVQEAGYAHHSDFPPGELLDELPYYGESLERHVAFGTGEPEDPEEKRLGKIANPTVHIGLNQTRKLVNALIEKHGQPAQIIVELARELKSSFEERERLRKEQAENQRKNDVRREKLASLGLADTGENRLRLRLWEELNHDAMDRRCVYTGEQISLTRLFSEEVEIEHILPFARTLDNGYANKTVSLRRANRVKGNLTPYEAFGHSPAGFNWDEIRARSQALPRNKRWRFGAGAMERFEGEEAGFLDRQLNETRYLSRVVREYLMHVCDPNQVWVSPGRLTAMLRGKWGLNTILSGNPAKNRDDHRHHAVDAAVVGVTDRSLLQRVSTAAGRAREGDAQRLLGDMPLPWEGFRGDLDRAVSGIVVSHRPDHGAGGKLHEETAYGIVDDHTLVFRKPLASLTRSEVANIRDPKIREEALAAVEGASGKRELAEALRSFAAEKGMRRVRILKTEAGFIPIRDREGKPYKALIPGENHHVDIIERDGRWEGEAVSVFHANQKGYQPAWMRENPRPKLIMRVHKGDLIKLLDKNGEEQVMRVVQLWKGLFCLAEHNEGGNLQQRHKDLEDSFRWDFASFSKLKDRKARKVHVDVLGRVHDPGAPR